MLTKNQVLIVLAVALSMISAGAVWLFGPFGLIGSGAVIAVISSLVDINNAGKE